MISIPESIWRFGWTVCPGCGSFGSRRGLVCDFCERHLREVSRAAFTTQNGWVQRHLLDWIPDQDDVLSNLLLALKGPGAREAWDEWAQIFLQVHGRERQFSFRNKVFVSAPAAHDGEDHSSLFARALARRLGRPYRGRILKKTSRSKRRKLDRLGRFTDEAYVKVTGFRLEPGEEIVFVDDVLTTGATVFAIRQALAEKRGFEAWTLASRTRSLAERPGL